MSARKPWRVDGPADRRTGQTYGSAVAAYEAVRELNGFGHDATVWHWEHGAWRLYERIEAERRCTAGQPDEPTRATCNRHQSHHWCGTCEGWYGVPHDGMHGPGSLHGSWLSVARQCACRPCKELVAKADK